MRACPGHTRAPRALVRRGRRAVRIHSSPPQPMRYGPRVTPSCARCHLLAAVLAADGSLGDDERDLLEQTMERLGLSDDERDRVRHFEGASGAADVLRPLPEADRRAL